MALPHLPGWKPLGGSSRRWKAANGRTVSRREYENKVLKGKGWRNRYEAEQFRQTKEYTRAKKRLARPKKGSPRRLDIFTDYAAFLRDVDWEAVELGWERKRGEGKTWDRGPNGITAQTLVLLGLRDEDWEWDVGDTPAGTTASAFG